MRSRHSQLATFLVACVVVAACSPFRGDPGSASLDGGTSDGGAGGAGVTDAAMADGGGGTGDAGCAEDTCAADAGSVCRADDFTSASCGPDWMITTMQQPSIAACAGGVMHITGGSTLDIVTSTSIPTPGVDYAVRISARLAVNDWDGGELLAIDFDGTPALQVNAVMGLSGPVFELFCSGTGTSPSCAKQTFQAVKGVPNLFTFDFTSTTTTVSVDCVPVATAPASAPLAKSASIGVDYGHVDPMPIDGTLSNFVVVFRNP